MTTTAREIIKSAFNKQTWDSDQLLKVGKLNRNAAWELVHQPSHPGVTQYKVTVIMLHPKNGEPMHLHNLLHSFCTTSAAMRYVDDLKKVFKVLEKELGAREQHVLNNLESVRLGLSYVEFIAEAEEDGHSDTFSVAFDGRLC